MKARRVPLPHSLRQFFRKRGQKHITTDPIAQTHTAQMPVIFTGRQEMRQGMLLDARTAIVGEALFSLHDPEKPARNDEPAEAQCRRQRLADRASINDMIRIESL